MCLPLSLMERAASFSDEKVKEDSGFRLHRQTRGDEDSSYGSQNWCVND